MPELEAEIKELIISSLRLEDVPADSIDPEAAIFGEGLGLDSIDALELGIAIQKRFGIKMGSDAAENKAHFSSVRNLAKFVTARRVAGGALP